MNWLALSPLEVAGLWTGLAAVALWLYLHHRRPQHKRVSSLRFWASIQPISQPRRRKLREPLAYAMQALFLLLLILALANIRLGYTIEGRSVAIVFDTSIWSQAHGAGGPSTIDRERREAIRVLSSLPSGDRVLLLRAEADTPPILPFTTDHAAVARAIQNVQPSMVAADIPHALEIGKAALKGSRQGLLVYVGPGMLDDEQQHGLDDFRADLNSSTVANQPQFLVRLAGQDAPEQNRGITRVSLRRDAAEPDHWHLLTQIKNYENAKANVVLKLTIDGAPLGQREVPLTPNELASTESEFTWDKGGMLRAEIAPSDALDADNRAVVHLPDFQIVKVGLYDRETSPLVTDLVPVLAGNPFVKTWTVPPGAVIDISPDVAIYEGARLPSSFKYNSIWFVTGSSSSSNRPQRIVGWNPQHPATRWVRTHDVSVRNPATLSVQPGDSVLATTEGTPPAPLIIARQQDGRRILVVGFNPRNSNFTSDSAFPLLLAGAIEWMTHPIAETADSFSTGAIDLPEPITRIVGPSGRDVPFAGKGSSAHFMALQTGIYRVVAPGGETSIAVNTPLLASGRIAPTSEESADVAGEPFKPAQSYLWRWLVILAILALWLEWWAYYASRERRRAAELKQSGYYEGAQLPPVGDPEVEILEPTERRDRNLVA